MTLRPFWTWSHCSRTFPRSVLHAAQVGTIIEQLEDKTSLVEFSDDQGRAYAIAPCRREDLLVLHYIPEAA